MRTIYKKTCIAGIILMVAIMAQQDIMMAVTDRTVSVTGSATKPMTPGPLLDDFRYAAPLNVWSMGTSTFSSSSSVPPPADAVCAARYINDSNAYSGYSLKLDYNVTALNAFAGYSSQLGGGSLVTPTAYTAISFYVKGAVGGEFFKIQLKNTSTTQYFDSNNNVHYYRNETAVYITDYLDGGVTTSWQKVTIPFHNFANLDGWSSMKEFIIVFENAQCGINGSQKQGTVYIDNIMFENIAIPAVRVDYFGDKLGVCALGGSSGTTADGGGTISYDFSSDGNYSLRLNYNVNTAGSWAASYTIFGGGNGAVEDPNKSGWIAIPHNFSAYNNLKLAVRAQSATGNPKYMKVEVVDAGGSRIVYLSGITDAWQTKIIPLSILSGLDKTSIKQINFVFEQDVIDSVGGNRAGVILVDSMRFDQ